MGRHILRRHIWGYSVCLCPTKRAGVGGLGGGKWGSGSGGRGGAEQGKRGREAGRDGGGKFLQISQRSETCTKILMRNLPTRNCKFCDTVDVF